jgi:hypothetical protein
VPTFQNDEIKARIADGSISAITVDTSIFDRYGCNLEYAVLGKLDQFRTGNTNVLISEIVKNEVQSHIARDAAESQRTLKSALSSHRKRWKLSNEDTAAPDAFRIADDPAAAAEEQFEAYVTKIGAEIIAASNPAEISVEVLRRYFEVEPPFEAGDKKKHEFPDAFALVSLEAWATRRETLLLCVSADKGWRDFADKSPRLVWIKSLDEALSLFNDSGRPVAEQVLARLQSNAAPDILTAIESAFEYRLDDHDYHIEAWSALEFEAEPLVATLQSIDWDSASAPVVVASDDDSVTFSFNLTALVGFEALFSYFHHDSIDRDYVSIGSEEEYKERHIEFELVLEVSRDDDPEIFEAQIAKRYFEVNFGEIEPFRNEDPTHEKY